jgi:hypothetical protein
LDTKLPWWWNSIYKRNAKNIDSNIWIPLMAPISQEELLLTVNGLALGLSSDLEGNNSSLLKAILFVNSPLLDLTLEMINKIMSIGDLPENWKKYYITLIEKKVEQLKVENMSDQLRPIAISHEYSKLVSKILANRMNTILMTNESVLSSAQRAFIRNGCTPMYLHVTQYL